MSFTNDGPSNFDQIGGTLSGIQKFIDDLKSEVHEKEQKIRKLEDELKKHGSPGLPIQNWKEFKDGLDKVIADYLSKAFSQTSHISQSLDSIEANQTFSTMESEEHAGSSSTSINHTSGNLSFQYISNHPNHESTESDFNRSNDFHNTGYDDYSDSKQMQVSMHMSPLPTLSSPQRRFPNGINNNFHNNNNNNNRNNNNNNNNNRKKNTVFVSWTGKMERNDLDNLFDRTDVTEIRYTPHKQFAHFDFRTNDAMNKALSLNKKMMNPEHGTLRVEAGRPRSNNNTENNNNNNNNNNNGQRPQNKNYNNRLQKQNGGMNGGYNQKPYKFQPNGINNFSNSHNNIDDVNDAPILSQGIQMANSETNL